MVERTVEWANKVADAKKNCPKLESKLQEELKELRKKHDAGDCNSFARGTLVLLADGSTKPIEEVELGDRVVATDPEAGESGPQKVVATIVGHGEKELVEVTVDVDGDAGDAVEVITATAEHPFWVDDHGRLLQPAAHGPWGEAPGWYDAADLDPGDQLRTPTGDRVRIVDVRIYITTTRVHNLTINGIHTYYVGADGKSVLTHNADEGLTADQQKKIRSYEQLIQEHEKLADYLADPDAYDNKGILKNAPNEEVRQRIINGRKNHLEKEIATFRANIEKVKKGCL